MMMTPTPKLQKPALTFTGTLALPEPAEHHKFWNDRIGIADHILAKASALESVLYGIAHHRRKFDGRTRYLIRKILLEVQGLLITGVPVSANYSEWLDGYDRTTDPTDLVLFPEYTDVDVWTPSLSRLGFAHLVETTNAIFRDFPATIGNTFSAIAEIRALAQRIEVYRKWEIEACIKVADYCCNADPNPLLDELAAMIREFVSPETALSAREIRAVCFSEYLVHTMHAVDVYDCMKNTCTTDGYRSVYSTILRVKEVWWADNNVRPDPSVWNDPSDYVPYRAEYIPADVLATLDGTKTCQEIMDIGRAPDDDQDPHDVQKPGWVENPHFNDDVLCIDRVIFRDPPGDFDQDFETDEEELEYDINANLDDLKVMHYLTTYAHRRGRTLPMLVIHEVHSRWRTLARELYDLMEHTDNRPMSYTAEIKAFNRSLVLKGEISLAECALIGALPGLGFLAKYEELTPFW
jgi:hypothetical protein